MAGVTSMQIEKSFSQAHQLRSLSPTSNLFHADWSNFATAQVLNPHFPVPNALIQCIDRFLILRLCLGSARNNPPRFVIGAFMDAMVKCLPEIRIILLIYCQSLDILPWDNNCSRVISIFGTSRSFSSRSCAPKVSKLFSAGHLHDKSTASTSSVN